VGGLELLNIKTKFPAQIKVFGEYQILQLEHSGQWFLWLICQSLFSGYAILSSFCSCFLHFGFVLLVQYLNCWERKHVNWLLARSLAKKLLKPGVYQSAMYCPLWWCVVYQFGRSYVYLVYYDEDENHLSFA